MKFFAPAYLVMQWLSLRGTYVLIAGLFLAPLTLGLASGGEWVHLTSALGVLGLMGLQWALTALAIYFLYAHYRRTAAGMTSPFART